MGLVTNFCIHRFLPLSLQKPIQSTSRVVARVALALNAVMFLAAVSFSVTFLDTWKKNAEKERPPKDLICSHFACTRVHGLVSGIALLSMFAQSDPLALALCLSTLKAVSDGTVWVLVLSAFTLAACNHFHYQKPRIFFGCLYMTNIFYAIHCYSEAESNDQEDDSRIGASVSSLCFGLMFLFYCLLRYILVRTKSGIVFLSKLPKKMAHRLSGNRD